MKCSNSQPKGDTRQSNAPETVTCMVDWKRKKLTLEHSCLVLMYYQNKNLSRSQGLSSYCPLEPARRGRERLRRENKNVILK